jgi:hypothetical protein
MVDFRNNMRGALFANRDKQNSNSPDYRGECEIEQVQYWISGWMNTSKGGNKFMSLSFKRKDGSHVNQQKPAPRPAPAVTEAEPFNDEIPF